MIFGRYRSARNISIGLILLCGLYFFFAPDNYHFFKPVNLLDKPTIVTDLKLRFANRDICFAALQNAQIEISPLPDETKGVGCGFYEVAKLEKSLLQWGDGVTLRCPMLAGLAMWERHFVVPAAKDILGSPVVRVHHYGTYSCRNINNASRGRRSQHATANAIDISGFTLADGRVVSVDKHWSGSSDEARFLRFIKAKACKRFNTVLGPDYNTLHKDHFHFDNGPSTSCR